MKKLTLIGILLVGILFSSSYPANNNNKMYIVEFELKQVHYSLKISKHIKDAANKVTFEIPVDKRYYDKVVLGESIVNKFRVGSLVMDGTRS